MPLPLPDLATTFLKIYKRVKRADDEADYLTRASAALMLHNRYLAGEVEELKKDNAAATQRNAALLAQAEHLNELNSHLTSANVYVVATSNRRLQGLLDVLSYRDAVGEIFDEAEAALWGE